jgi:hypothetical protein
LTALTVLTRLTVLTADRIGVVANVDDFSEIIYERQGDRNWASGFLLSRLAHKVDEDLCQCSVGSEASSKNPIAIRVFRLATLNLGPQLIHQLPLK